MKKYLFILLSILYSYSAVGQMNIKVSAGGVLGSGTISIQNDS